MYIVDISLTKFDVIHVTYCLCVNIMIQKPFWNLLLHYDDENVVQTNIISPVLMFLLKICVYNN